MLKQIQRNNSEFSSMDTLKAVPDCTNSHKVQLNNNEIEVNFRYFSPKKYQQSNVSHNTNPNGPASGSYYVNYSAKSSVVQNQITITKQLLDQKVFLDPKSSSDKFYLENLKEIKHLGIQYFEQFHNKLLKKNENKQEQKIIKLKLTHPAKSSVKKIDKNLYIKRVQISLSNLMAHQNQTSVINSPLKNSQNPPHQTRQSRLLNPPHQKFVIKLYNDNKKQNDGYTTPRDRSGSRKKGITVYSSCSTKKKQEEDNAYVHTENNCNFSVNNVSTRAVERERDSKSKTPSYERKGQPNKDGLKSSLRERYGSQFVQNLKRKAQLTKKRVYSRSRITRKLTPLSFSAPKPKK